MGTMYNEKVSGLFTKLSNESKAAWAECALFSQIMKKRLGYGVSKHLVIEQIRAIGWNMADSDRMREFLETDAERDLREAELSCRKAESAINYWKSVDWELTPEEYALFKDIMSSNLFNEILENIKTGAESMKDCFRM